MTLYAKWDKEEAFNTTYGQLDECIFNGKDINITGEKCNYK